MSKKTVDPFLEAGTQVIAAAFARVPGSENIGFDNESVTFVVLGELAIIGMKLFLGNEEIGCSGFVLLTCQAMDDFQAPFDFDAEPVKEVSSAGPSDGLSPEDWYVVGVRFEGCALEECGILSDEAHFDLEDVHDLYAARPWQCCLKPAHPSVEEEVREKVIELFELSRAFKNFWGI